jgi:small subunit ribosomal protein S4
MSSQSNSKCRLCRREGEKLLLKGERCSSPKCAMVKRSFPPGMHGEKGGRQTQYGRQLRAKQKVKRIYGLRERQFRSYYEEASKSPGVTGDLVLQSLERRLDNVIFRLGLAVSRTQARQLVNHATFTVNDKRADIPSFQVKTGDVITVRKTKQGKKYFTSLAKKLSNKNLPEWLELDVKKMSGRILNLPTKSDVDLSADMQLIVELYSR